MSPLPNLPKLPNLDDSDALSEPTLDWHKALLPALGGLAVGGEAGGGFLRGFARGQQLQLERRQAAAEKAEQRTRQREQYIDGIVEAALKAESPEIFEQIITIGERRGVERFGIKPGDIRSQVGQFPESKVNKRRQALARDRVGEMQRVYPDKFWSAEIQAATVPFEGQEIKVSDLVAIADILATQDTKRPIFETRPTIGEMGPRVGAEALTVDPRTGRPLEPQRVRVGEEIVREPIKPGAPERVTFDQLYPKAQGTAWEGRPIPYKDGVPDLRTASQIAKDNQWISTPEDQFKARQHYQQFLRDKLIAGMRSGGVNLGVLRKQMEQAGLSWAAETDKAKQQIALEVATLAGKQKQAQPKPAAGTSVVDRRRLEDAEAELAAAEEEKKLLLANPPGKHDKSRATWENRLRAVNGRILKARSKVNRLRGGAPAPRSPTNGSAAPTQTPVPSGTVPLDAKEYVGKTVRGPNGKKYRSDGVNWYEVK